MKFLLDMNLSPDWVATFEGQGFEALHWSQIGDARAADTVIMTFARQHGYIVFTHDLDFGAMLAAAQATSPSVIQARTQDVTPTALASRLFATIEQFRHELKEGALLILDVRKERIRLLPLQR